MSNISLLQLFMWIHSTIEYVTQLHLNKIYENDGT